MLPDFRLETFFSRWEFNARYHMCASDMETLSMSELLGLADDSDLDAWRSLRLGYTETYGSPALRDAIAATYANAAPRDVLTFAGAEEGIFATMHALLDAGDHAIVVTPNYQAAETLPASICRTTGVPLDPANDWHLDLDRVADSIRPETKVLSVNFPHNPTGKVIDRETLDALIGLCRRHGIYLFSDEVYRFLERDESIRLPQVADVYERGLSLNVMSKAYGLPGLRIGWVVCRCPEVLSRAERMKHYLSICNSAPSEVLARIALGARDRIIARNHALIRDNLAALGDFFAEFPELFEWYVPDGGCIGYPRYLGGDGVEAFCADLVNRAGILLLPASAYRSGLTESPEDRFRIGYGRKDMIAGLEAMMRHLTGK